MNTKRVEWEEAAGVIGSGKTTVSFILLAENCVVRIAGNHWNIYHGNEGGV